MTAPIVNGFAASAGIDLSDDLPGISGGRDAGNGFSSSSGGGSSVPASHHDNAAAIMNGVGGAGSTGVSGGVVAVIGSMQRMQDYQAVVVRLRGAASGGGAQSVGASGAEEVVVRGEMVDRLVQGGECLREFALSPTLSFFFFFFFFSSSSLFPLCKQAS